MSNKCPIPVLGPILFLIYINDLPDGVIHSEVRMFADYCIDMIQILIDSINSDEMAAVYTVHTSSIRIFNCLDFPNEPARAN